MFEFTSIGTVLFIATVINFFVALISWQRRRTKSGLYFAWGVSALAVWTLASGLDYAATPVLYKVFFAKIEYIAYNSALAFFVLFTLYYAGYEIWLKQKWVRILIWGVPLSNILLALTNELHHWLWSGFSRNQEWENLLVFHHGPGFVWVAGTGYFAIILILVGLWSASNRGGALMRKQSRLLFFAALFPVLGNLLYLQGIEEMHGLDWTAIFFTLSGLLFIIALYGAHFLGLIPVARETLINSLRDGLVVLDERNRILDINQVAESMFMDGAQSLVGTDFVNIFPSVQPYLEKPLEQEIQAELVIKLAEKRYVDMLISPLLKGSGEILGRLIVFRDITVVKENELRLLHLTQAVEQSPATVMITDPEGKITYVNPQFNLLTGYSHEEAIGKKPSIVQSNQTPDSVYKEMWKTILAGGVWRGEFLNKKKSGELYWEWSVIAPVRDFEGKIISFIAVKENITKRKRAEEALKKANLRLETQLEEIKKLEATLREQAIRDPLTQLYNRRFLVDALEREFSAARRHKRFLSIFILDIDHFKMVNDTYGHRAGDICLIKVAHLLKEFFREADIVCRFGGEEFLVVLPDAGPKSARRRAEAFRMLVANTTISISDEELQLTISGGVASFPMHGKKPEDVIQKADQALYAAKRQERNRVVLYKNN